jgi:hypothetical protein
VILKIHPDTIDDEEFDTDLGDMTKDKKRQKLFTKY